MCGLTDIETTGQGKIDKDHQEELIAYSLLLEDDSIMAANSNFSNSNASVISCK